MSSYSVHQFAEKVALISNAADPIGRAAAMQLALHGAFVVGLFPDVDRGLEELVELGTLAVSVQADAATAQGAEKAASAVANKFGRLDFLVNCTLPGPSDGAECLTRAVLPLMSDRPRARIVNILVSPPERVGASGPPAERDGVMAMTELSHELPANFRLNSILVSAPHPQAENALAVSPPSPQPADIARVALFLLSSEATALDRNILTIG